MAINQKDIKLLWGRSASRCAICKTELTQDKAAVTSAYALGEQAHIVGEKADAARGISSLTLEDRNSYHNLILLCPNHHTEIDKNEDDWPVEKLHFKKSEHELWVNETLSQTADQVKLAKEVSITSVIDAAVKYCRLDTWHAWTSFALSPDPTWPRELPNEIFEFRLKVIAAIWPKEFEELNRAITTLSISLSLASNKFMEHSELHGDTYYPHKFYKAGDWNDNFNHDLKKYNDWVDSCHATIHFATKAANWVGDVVRKDINPMFFAESGKFLTIEGDIRGFDARLLEFTNEERERLPDALNL